MIILTWLRTTGIARELIQRRERGEAGTEELRQAIVNYRALFADLLEVEPNERERGRNVMNQSLVVIAIWKTQTS